MSWGLDGTGLKICQRVTRTGGDWVAGVVGERRQSGAERVSVRFGPGVPFRSPANWELNGDSLSRDGEPVLDLTEVNRVHSVDEWNRGKHATLLRLKAPSGKVVISTWAQPGSQYHADCQRLRAAILRRLAVVDGEIPVNLKGGRARMFVTLLATGALFVLSLIGSVAFFVEPGNWRLIFSLPTLVLCGIYAYGEMASMKKAETTVANVVSATNHLG